MGNTPRTVVLCILDGWGYREETAYNAVANAHTPTYDKLWNQQPRCMVATSSHDVGLPPGQMGNSEVGHMNIGAGRVMLQDLPRINKAMAEDTIKNEPALQSLITKLSASGGACHMLGLLSTGGVHGHMDHMVAIAKILSELKIPVRIHGFSDGRDTAPKSAAKFVSAFEAAIAGLNDVKIATVGGRYFGMDRDNRWDRVNKAYATMVDASGPRCRTAGEAIAKAYASDNTDEFIDPTAIGTYLGMVNGDGLLMTNFRADRVREILSALVNPTFDSFERRTVQFATQLGMVSYSSALDAILPALFPPITITQSLGEVVSRAGLKQLRIAETEKYPHVTYFLNAGKEEVFEGEDRILIPSPKVATYDLKPEMSAQDVTNHTVQTLRAGSHQLIIVNYANGDMVGHTGVYEAAVKAAEAVDVCLRQLLDAVNLSGGVILVTADHGNAEQMRDEETGEPHTQHTTTPVPLMAAGAISEDLTLKDGRLADIAPTILQLLGLKQPAVMTGSSLILDGAVYDAPE